MAKPPVVSLCCQVGRQVVDKFGPGISQSQAGGLVEALVARLARGIAGEKEARSASGRTPPLSRRKCISVEVIRVVPPICCWKLRFQRKVEPFLMPVYISPVNSVGIELTVTHPVRVKF